MTKAEVARAYVTEPLLSGLVLSLLVNYFGRDTNAKFMHGEARDILSLGVVLLAAALALWVGLFWMSNSEFGRWLEGKKMLEPINSAYVASAIVLPGEFVALWGISTMITLLSNTRNLLQLHGLYGRQPKVVSEIKAGIK
jgi:hypothetical protein